MYFLLFFSMGFNGFQWFFERIGPCLYLLKKLKFVCDYILIKYDAISHYYQ